MDAQSFVSSSFPYPHLSLKISQQLLPSIITTAWAHIDNAETFAFRLANLEVLINAVLYNPALSISVLASAAGPSAPRVFFDKWFAAINAADKKLPRVHDKRLSILTLCALMEMDEAAVPHELKDGWPGLVSGVLRIFKEWPKALEGGCFLLAIFI